MGWDGMLVTDWSEIRNQHSWHRVAETHEDAVEIAMTETTIDMSMVPDTIRSGHVDGMEDHGGSIMSAATSFPTDLTALATAGKVSGKRIDVAVGRVLQLKEDLGLLDDPMLDAARDLIPTVGQDQDREVARAIARESLTLLRNEPVTWSSFVSLTRVHLASLKMHGWGFSECFGCVTLAGCPTGGAGAAASPRQEDPGHRCCRGLAPAALRCALKMIGVSIGMCRVPPSPLVQYPGNGVHGSLWVYRWLDEPLARSCG
jgi:hypothetical protein